MNYKLSDNINLKYVRMLSDNSKLAMVNACKETGTIVSERKFNTTRKICKYIISKKILQLFSLCSHVG